MSLPSSYTITDDKGNRKTRAILRNLDIVEVEEGRHVDALPINMNKGNAWRFVIKMDRAGNEKGLRNKIENFFYDHPMCRNVVYDEKEVCFSENFVYEFTDTVIKAELDRDNAIVEAYTKFQSLDDSQREAIAIYFGQQAFELDKETLERTMISLDGGIITANEKNRRAFLDSIETMFNPTLLNLNLAINYGIIPSDGEVYLIAGSPIGRTIPECLSTLQQNPDKYSQLKRDIEATGRKPFRELEDTGSVKAPEPKKAALPAGKHSGK